ncbi:hypothetical protein I4U23_012142 [Adineta vaga]|nr:hypothetical protein I4U23_012142 [Adineta vaga]
MNISKLTQQLLKVKRDKCLSFADIGKKIGRDEVWAAALLYGQASMTDDECKKLDHTLGINLTPQEVHELTHPPSKGTLIKAFPPTDPLLYRFHEILAVYGIPMKEVIHEKFGDGIMSAVDFTIKIDKDDTNKDAPRVNVTMSGKFLPYKKW